MQVFTDKLYQSLMLLYQFNDDIVQSLLLLLLLIRLLCLNPPIS